MTEAQSTDTYTLADVERLARLADSEIFGEDLLGENVDEEVITALNSVRVFAQRSTPETTTLGEVNNIAAQLTILMKVFPFAFIPTSK